MTREEEAAALKVECGLKLCGAKPGEPCVNSYDGVGPRDEPHWNRVARGVGKGQRSEAAVSSEGQSRTPAELSAQLRQTQEELARAKSLLDRLSRTSEEAHRATAEKLLHAQRDLAASQADLTRVEQQRDEAIDEAERLECERDGVREELARQAADNDDLRRSLDLARAELVSARTELDRLRRGER